MHSLMAKTKTHGWIESVAPEDATGLLAKLYKAALGRSGRVFNVLRIQSLRPKVLRVSTQLYTELMHSKESPLSKAQREMLATAVSSTIACAY